MKKIGLLSLALLIALCSLGVAYSSWSAPLAIGGSLATATYPTVTTSDASTPIGITTAIINGNLGSLGTATTVKVYFDYGTSSVYGSSTSLQNKTTTGVFSANLTGLLANTVYHFRANAIGGNTTQTNGLISHGVDKTLQTYPTLQITTTLLPNGKKSKAYGTAGGTPPTAVYIIATGGHPGYSWAIISGALPTGLMLNSSTGQITGTSPADNNRTYNFTVQVTDVDGNTASKSLSITVTNTG